MKIEISDDTAVGIMVDVMLHDYKQLVADIDRYLEKPILSEVEQSDLKNWRTVLISLEIVLEYYIGSNWKQRYVG